MADELTGLGASRPSRRLLAAGAVLVGVLGLAALAAPWLTPYDPDAIVVASYHGPLAPGGGHLLGTDTLGRDVWARLVYGARTSLFVGGLAMAASLAIGMTAGLVAGYFGGVTDAALMWVVDLVLTMPSLLLLIVLATVLPPSLLTIPLVIGAIGWTTFARTVRGEVLSLRERDYISAARALGASDPRIILRHLLPGVLPGVVVLAALGMSGAIVVDAGLSYLGLGVPLPTPSWGRMVSDAQTYIAVAPWLLLAPGVAIALAVIGFNLIGYGLIDLIGRRNA
ncbi:MAG TPA: ABC transporter permease [Candidatus Nitrosopolaris sp.]|nr:ABC transporter permease [Candidatus Nitrosopolaris sp.]